jgi:molecular chaperone DnaK
MIQSFFDRATLEVCRKLEVWLPEVGGQKWWQFYVYDQLSISQQRVLLSTDGRLDELDAAGLLRVLARNWHELSNHKAITGIKKNGFKFVKEAQDIRNELAHKKVNQTIDHKDLIRYLDTLSRLIQEISGDPALIKDLNTAWNLAIKGGLDDANKDKSISDPDHQSFIESNSASIEDVEINSSPKQEGGHVLISPALTESIKSKIKHTTFVGIDFGTSTTVVTVVTLNASTNTLTLSPLSIHQPTVYGDYLEHHLVNSVLTFNKGGLLFGKDAYRIKANHVEGESTFSSFKMQLGINQALGYPRSQVKAIGSAQDATIEFFKLLRAEIMSSVKRLGLSPELRFSVSVPASFEANQRRDLTACLESAGYEINASSLIDEPNAAFLSYLNESAIASNSFVTSLKDAAKKIMVFDFGAGTCDVSVLATKIKDSNLISQNKSISRFMALGGDDIDRTIVKKLLIKKLFFDGAPIDQAINGISNEMIAQAVIPWLMPIAEMLKIYCTDHLRDLQINTLKEAKNIDYVATTADPASLKIDGKIISVNNPSISMNEFVQIIDSFSRPNNIGRSGGVSDEDDYEIGEPKYLYAPVENALGKAELSEGDIDAILFIGGSAKNPLVRAAITDNFPESTKIIVPRDLQTHVSQGAALHSLCHHGLGVDLIRPITSEPIFIVTKGGGLKMVVPPGSPVPSDEEFIEYLTVSRSGQREIELPLCVSNENKLLGLIRVTSPNNKGFQKGESISISCSITHDKLLDARVVIGDMVRRVALLNPLSNTELSPKELAMLEAKQNYNEAILANGGRPTAKAALAYASALEGAGLYLEAAEQFIQVEVLSGNANHATSICYCYSLGGKSQESNRWGKIAYDRVKTDVTTYNYALSHSSTSPLFEQLLLDCLEINPSYPPALKLLGSLFKNKGRPEGIDHLETASDILSKKLELNNISASECDLLVRIEEELGRDSYSDIARTRKAMLLDTPRVFQEDNLATSDSFSLTARG